MSSEVEKTRILIVDDEEDAISSLQFRLANMGYDVITADNGATAMQVLRDAKVDVILADFMMPEVNGLELARLVKSNPNWFDTRVILFSCNTDPEFRRRAIELGALDYLPKTGGYNTIVERVAEIAAPQTPAQHVSLLEGDSPDETSFRMQLGSLSRSLIDVLQLAGMNEALPDSVQYALNSAKRIAEDIQKLSASEEELDDQIRKTSNAVKS